MTDFYENYEFSICDHCNKIVNDDEGVRTDDGCYIHPECAADYAEEASDEAAHQSELWSNWNE